MQKSFGSIPSRGKDPKVETIFGHGFFGHLLIMPLAGLGDGLCDRQKQVRLAIYEYTFTTQSYINATAEKSLDRSKIRRGDQAE